MQKDLEVRLSWKRLLGYPMCCSLANKTEKQICCSSSSPFPMTSNDEGLSDKNQHLVLLLSSRFHGCATKKTIEGALSGINDVNSNRDRLSQCEATRPMTFRFIDDANSPHDLSGSLSYPWVL